MRPRSRTLFVAAACSVALWPAAPGAAQENRLPAQLQGVAFDQKLGDSVPLDALFTDEEGRQRPLGDFLGERPAVLALVYYDCPMLCTMTLNGMTNTLRALTFDAGDQYDVLAVSFDPREGPDLARRKRQAYLESYARPGTEDGWHFLTGSPEAIARLTESVGFHYLWDEKGQQFAHATGLVVLTPEGRIARYFYGVEYSARDLRLGLVEAASGGIGSVVDQVLLFCFHYDPETGRYSALTLRTMRVAGVATVGGLALMVVVFLRRERKREAGR